MSETTEVEQSLLWLERLECKERKGRAFFWATHYSALGDIFLLIYFLGEYYIIYYSCYSTFAYLTQVRWTGIILWHNNVAWNDPLAQLLLYSLLRP